MTENPFSTPEVQQLEPSPGHNPFRWMQILGVGSILLVLAAVLLPAVTRGPAIGAARQTQCKNNLRQIRLALESYHDEYHALPTPTDKSCTVGERWFCPSWNTKHFTSRSIYRNRGTIRSTPLCRQRCQKYTVAPVGISRMEILHTWEQLVRNFAFIPRRHGRSRISLTACLRH